MFESKKHFWIKRPQPSLSQIWLFPTVRFQMSPQVASLSKLCWDVGQSAPSLLPNKLFITKLFFPTPLRSNKQTPSETDRPSVHPFDSDLSSKNSFCPEMEKCPQARCFLRNYLSSKVWTVNTLVWNILYRFFPPMRRSFCHQRISDTKILPSVFCVTRRRRRNSSSWMLN